MGPCSFGLLLYLLLPLKWTHSFSFFHATSLSQSSRRVSELLKEKKLQKLPFNAAGERRWLVTSQDASSKRIFGSLTDVYTAQRVYQRMVINMAVFPACLGAYEKKDKGKIRGIKHRSIPIRLCQQTALIIFYSTVLYSILSLNHYSINSLL